MIEQGCVISNNTAGRWGGGVFTGSATTSTPPTTISNSTIANNTSGSALGIGGGGVFVSGVNVTGAGIPTISNSRIVGNTTTAASGSQLGAHTTDNAQLNAINNWYRDEHAAGFLLQRECDFDALPRHRPFRASPTTVNVGQTSTVTAVDHEKLEQPNRLHRAERNAGQLLGRARHDEPDQQHADERDAQFHLHGNDGGRGKFHRHGR